MRNPLFATALVAVALLGAGCKKSPSLVGKWTGTMGGQTADFEFKPDNTMSTTSKRGPVESTITGDYKVDGDKFTLTFKDVQLKGVPEAYQAMAKKMVGGALNKPQTGKLVFTSDDAVTLSTDTAGATAQAGGATPPSIALTRVKEGA